MSCKRWLRIPDACRKAGNISRATYYRHAAAGLLPKPFRVGGVSVVDEDALDAQMAEHAASNEAA